VLRLNRFSYLAPASTEEAIELLQTHGQEAMLMAGGTDLLPNIKDRLFTPSYVIGIRQLPEMQRVALGDDGWLSIGAGVSLQRLESDPLITKAYPALAYAAQLISTPQVRAVGTVGGNICLDTRCNYYNQSYEWRKAIGFCMKRDGDICLVARSSPRCWAVSSSDSAPVALALNTEVVLLGTKGERRIPAKDLYRDDGINYTTKRPEEVILNLVLPAGKKKLTSAYWKLRRRGSFDFPILGVAIALTWDDGAIAEATGALGAVGSLPVDITSFLRPLNGQRPSDELIAEVAEAADKRSRPLDNTDLSHYWRKRMTRVYIERALREAAGLDPMANRLTALHGTAPAAL
jgi:4-hydroxybenzoyl-CoA reductase subunit beta